MNRPRQHIIETISSKYLERAIPDEWVARELGKDYGYDYLIEIFENNVSTGKTFFIQLKGSDQEIKNDQMEIQLKTSNLDYFNKSLLPVLLVFCSTKTKQLWAIWANELINSLSINENQKSKLIKLSKKNQISQQYFHNLSKVFSIDIINKININSYCDNDLCEKYSGIINSYLSHYYNKNLIFNDHTLSKSLEMSFKKKDASIEVSISFNHIKKKIEVNLSNKFDFLYKPITNYSIIEKEFKELLAIISIILIEINTASSLEILTLSISELKDIENLLNVGYVANKNKEFSRFQTLVQETIQLKMTDHYQMLNMAYVFSSSKDNNIIKYYQENTIRAINSLEGGLTKGLQYYNLANSFASCDEHNKAIKYYFLARKYNPSYSKTHYWWRELGAQLFFKGHYKFAEQFYRKYLRIAKDNPDLFDPIIYALIGDCLFYQCRFSLAKMDFQIFLSKSESYLSEWVLKNHICDFFINNELDNVKINKEDSMKYAEQAFQEVTKGKNEKALSFLVKSIEIMPSNNWAWFNFASISNDLERFDEAQNAFLVAALFADWDREAWIKSLFLAFNLKKDYLFFEIVNALHHKYGDSIKQQLSDFIFSQSQMELGKRKGFYDAIENVFDSINDPDKLNNLKMNFDKDDIV